MDNFIVFSDLHVHNYKKFNSDGRRMNYCIQVIENVFQKAQEEKAHILFGGDLYDQQQSLPTVVINKVIKALKNCFERYPDVNFIAISGNHDHATKNTIGSPAVSAMEHLWDVFDGRFILIDNGFVEVGGTIVYGVPYYESPDDFKTRLLEARALAEGRTDKAAVLLIHQTPGGIGNEMIIPDTVASDPAYAAFDLVFCGHIHQGQQIAPGFYVVGSPLHRDLGDEGDKKSIITLSIDDAGIQLSRLLTGYPEYKRVTVAAGEAVPENDFDYIVVVPVVADIAQQEQEISQTEFGADLSARVLIENYAKKLLPSSSLADYMNVGVVLLGSN